LGGSGTEVQRVVGVGYADFFSAPPTLNDQKQAIKLTSFLSSICENTIEEGAYNVGFENGE
jgi:hypothetical protein